MSRFEQDALEMRAIEGPGGRPMYGCSQAVAAVFAEAAGYDRETAVRAAAYLRGGMQMGSVCGALSGGLVVLGLSGLKDPEAGSTLIRTFRENHEGMTDCAELLADNAGKGGEKKPFCDAVICGTIRCVEAILRERGILKEED